MAISNGIESSHRQVKSQERERPAHERQRGMAPGGDKPRREPASAPEREVGRHDPGAIPFPGTPGAPAFRARCPRAPAAHSVLSQYAIASHRNRPPSSSGSGMRFPPQSRGARGPGAAPVERMVDEQGALLGAVAPPCDLGVGRRRIDLPAQVDEGRASLADARLELRGLVDVRVGVVEAWEGGLRPERHPDEQALQRQTQDEPGQEPALVRAREAGHGCPATMA